LWIFVFIQEKSILSHRRKTFKIAIKLFYRGFGIMCRNINTTCNCEDFCAPAKPGAGVNEETTGAFFDHTKKALYIKYQWIST
jgi:hypothetical protein